MKIGHFDIGPFVATSRIRYIALEYRLIKRKSMGYSSEDLLLLLPYSLKVPIIDSID